VSVVKNASRTTAIAGKPAPTFELRRAQKISTPAIPCGSGLARDGGVSVAKNSSRTTAFAGKPAPTF
jgi:hypothetical protein